MNNKVLRIFPKDNKFTGGRVKTTYQDHLDKTQKSVTGKWNTSVAPNTIQKIRPIYSKSKAQFYCSLTQEQLDKLIPECYFIDSNGDRIMNCDKKNPRDPIFNHKDIYIRMKEGEYRFNVNDPKDVLRLACIEANPVTTTDINKKKYDTKYLLYDQESNQERVKKSLNRNEKAWKLFFKMNAGTKRIIAQSLGMKIDQNTSNEYVDDYLKLSIDNTIDDFLRIASMDKEDLAIQEIFNKAREAKIITRQRNLYRLNGETIGKSQDQVLSFLKDDNNQEQYDHILKRLENV